jgi:hypothetical protein
MKKGQFNFCGEDLHVNNSHWLSVYGHLLIALSNVKMEETFHLTQFPDSECDGDYPDYTNGVQAVSAFFEKKGMPYIEGYTLYRLSDWFIHFCKDWHSKNTEVQKKIKQDQIDRLKKELAELEGTTE